MWSCRAGESQTTCRRTFSRLQPRAEEPPFSPHYSKPSSMKSSWTRLCGERFSPTAAAPRLPRTTHRLHWERPSRTASTSPESHLSCALHSLPKPWQKPCYYRHQNFPFIRNQGRNNPSCLPCIMQQGGSLVRVCLHVCRAQGRNLRKTTARNTMSPQQRSPGRSFKS